MSSVRKYCTVIVEWPLNRPTQLVVVIACRDGRDNSVVPQALTTTLLYCYQATRQHYYCQTHSLTRVPSAFNHSGGFSDTRSLGVLSREPLMHPSQSLPRPPIRPPSALILPSVLQRTLPALALEAREASVSQTLLAVPQLCILALSSART